MNFRYHDLHMSDNLQSVDLDIDMLSPDFYVSTTTSGKGSQYNAFVQSHIPNAQRVHPLCQHPTDLFHLVQTPGQPPNAINLTFPMCSPSHSHSLTLSPSGALLGLSPPTTQLSRLTSPPLLTQLHDLNLIASKIWSLTLLTPTGGILTLGSTIASHAARASISTEISLANFGNPLFTPSHIDKLVEEEMSRSFPAELEEQFHWVKVSGPKGRWMALLSGVWVGGSKVLKNQPVLFDVNCPFILAPPLAGRRFYESIGGAQRLGGAVRHDNAGQSATSGFWKFPCLNKVSVAWEFRGKMLPAFKEGGREEGIFGPAGGAMSLGKLGDGEDFSSGYCVGIVAETDMGLGRREGGDPWRNSGMRDVWVLGEPFFRGLGVVFDPETDGGRIGFRNY
jgi:hypothetical protein